jgi:hypothetical protein
MLLDIGCLSFTLFFGAAMNYMPSVEAAPHKRDGTVS